jgi:hypothetical protein
MCESIVRTSVANSSLEEVIKDRVKLKKIMREEL